MKIILPFLILLLSFNLTSQNQILSYKLQEECNENKSINPYNHCVIEKIDSIHRSDDSIKFYITFRQNCSFKNIESIKLVNTDDTLYFTYELLFDEGKAMCSCLYNIELSILNQEFEVVSWGGEILENTSKNYDFENILIERHKSGEIKRIIYGSGGYVLVEEHYKENKTLDYTIFYEKNTGKS